MIIVFGRDRLRDAEVEELHGAVSGHEDVRRLQVTVHDHLTVRILDRFAHLAEEREPLSDRHLPSAAVLRERNSFHVLHGKPGRTVWQRVGVVESRDRRMIEMRQDPLLVGEALTTCRRQPSVAQDLDRDQAAQIRPFGQIHDAHAPFTEGVPQPVGMEPIGFEGRGAGWQDHVVCDDRDVPVEQRGAPILVEKREHIIDERRVVGAAGFQPYAPLGRGPISDVVK